MVHLKSISTLQAKIISYINKYHYTYWCQQAFFSKNLQRSYKIILIVFFVFLLGLKRLKGDYDTSKDMAEMKAEKEEAMKEAKMSILRLLRSSMYRQQLFVALMMHFSQQFSGINAVCSF